MSCSSPCACGPALVAIDLGAESCRVSLLRWAGDEPHGSSGGKPRISRPRISMVRRFANAPQDCGTAGLRWNLSFICDELEAGLRDCAALAPEGIAAIGVTGWAVDYVRLDAAGQPLAPPFCYRDSRAQASMQAVHAIVPPGELYARTGVQIQPLNTLYQLFADRQAGDAPAPWVNLPEYILHRLGAPRVAEYTNATHTGLVDAERRQWSDELFTALGLDRAAAPELVAPGTVLGPLRGPLAALPAFGATQLIAPACHDTASAIAGIPQPAGPWAYHSCGTWSLVGMLLSSGVRSADAFARGFTNLGSAGGGVLFHRGVAGMWLLRQCMNCWDREQPWRLEDLIDAARRIPPPESPLDLDDPAFILPGEMPGRINAQRRRNGLPPLPEGCEAAPHYASLIWHSLAARYAALVGDIERLTGRRPERICVVGGGSRNAYLNALTAEAAGIPVERGPAESATLGNLALQWAALDGAGADFSNRLDALAGASFFQEKD